MDWITDRLPTEADADGDGDVLCLRYRMDIASWKNVESGEPWLPLAPSSTPRPRRIVSITRTVQESGDHTIDAVADDGTAWWMIAGVTDGWTQLPALPDRG